MIVDKLDLEQFYIGNNKYSIPVDYFEQLSKERIGKSMKEVFIDGVGDRIVKVKPQEPSTEEDYKKYYNGLFFLVDRLNDLINDNFSFPSKEFPCGFYAISIIEENNFNKVFIEFREQDGLVIPICIKGGPGLKTNADKLVFYKLVYHEFLKIILFTKDSIGGTEGLNGFPIFALSAETIAYSGLKKVREYREKNNKTI